MRRRLAPIAVALLLAVVALTAGLRQRTLTNPLPDCEGAQSIDAGCFAARYAALTQMAGVRVSLADLDRRRRSNEYLSTMCHQLTHAIGRAAGERRGKSAFAEGTDVCASGYYHGVVEAVMAGVGRDQILERALAVCGAERERFRGSYLHYNCTHGMGHGFMGLYQSDIFQSLSGCDVLPDEWERRHCYGGVFMENLSAMANPARPSKHLRPAEPLYPCTAVDARYKGDCYIEQTAYALFVRNDDFADVFRLCGEEADRTFRGVCYEGLGGDAAIKASKYVIGEAAQAETIRALCLLGDDAETRSHCVIGAVSTIIRDLSGDDTRARTLCSALRDERLTNVCEAARAAELSAFGAGKSEPHHH